MPAYGGEDSVQTELQAALDTLDQGVSYLEQNADQSQETLQRASAMLESFMDEYEYYSPELYLALGNAYRLQGDLGHAILAYRRGEELDPTNAALYDSLESTRALVDVAVEPDTENRVASWLLLWRGHIPRLVLWSIFVSFFALGWFIWSARIMGFIPKRGRGVGITLIVLSMVPMGLLTLDWRVNQSTQSAVLVGADVVARSGPDDSIYEPVYDHPLSPGVEATILDSRDQWKKIKLLDGSECWVPNDTLELINSINDQSRS